MTTKNFNAKKVLMSTVAAVVFSFVFTTNANAQSVENKQNGLEEFTDFVVNMFQTVFGVRV